MQTLATIGFWFEPMAPSALPRADALVGRWTPRDRAAVLAHLRRGVVVARYNHFSSCRFVCGAHHNGRLERSDGTWVWPSGLAHYVEAHHVRLPPAFVAAAHNGTSKPILGTFRYSDNAWLAWANAQGATLPIAPPWDVPGQVDRQRIWRDLCQRLPRAAQELASPDTLVLANAETRVVIAVGSKQRIVVVRLTAEPQHRLARSWPDAWNLAMQLATKVRSR